MVAGVEDIYFWREQVRLLREYNLYYSPWWSNQTFVVAMAASGGDCQKCGHVTPHRYFYGSIAVCAECYRNAVGAEPPVSQSQRVTDGATEGLPQEAAEVYPRPRPKSCIEDADEISKRIRELAQQENRQPTIDRICPPKQPETPES